ncbi:MAG: M48 family metalloprotease [Pseudomonadota bacterium]
MPLLSLRRRRHSWLGTRLRALGHGALAAVCATGMSLSAIAPASAQTILRDAEIEQWLWDHSYEIFEAAKLDPNSIEFLIIGDASVNAFASGRTMGMFTGTITSADTPNEIEGVIAHEAGHMAGGHGPRRADAYAKASRPILLSLVLAAGAIAAGAPEAGIGLLGLGQQIGTVNALAYTRGQEASADQAAVSYMNAVGRSSAGLVSFFAKLRNSQVITARRINPYFQTHPLANARLTALEKRVNASPYVDVKDSEEEIRRLRMIQAKIKGFLQAPKFTLREYPTSDLSDPGRYARAVAFYRGTDLERALREINALLEKYPDNPYFQELKGQMLFEFGRVGDAVEPHRRSVELAPTKALLRVNLGRALLATETNDNLEESVKVLRSALQLEPENGFGWHELARAYGSLGNEPMALLATAESHYHAGSVQAVQFAQRALRGFERGTPEWQQARDIIVAVSNATNRRGRGNRRQRPQRVPDAPERGQRDKNGQGEDDADDKPIEILIPGETPNTPEKEDDDAPLELPEAPAKKG